jgi:cyclase
VVLDIKKKLLGGYEICTHNGNKLTGINPIKFAKELEQMGAGELILNSIDNDGVMKGYDMSLIDKVAEVVSIPITVLGGAGSLSDMEKVIDKHGVIGAAAGSLFVFKGPYKAVLINYPSRNEKNKLFKISESGNTK